MPNLNLTVQERTSILYKNMVRTITSFNDKGKFDITPKHANFISLIKDKLIIRERSGATKEIKIDNAIIKVLKNKVDVYLGIKKE